MFDSYNREINYLRISITDRCNLRCVYCMPKEGVCLKKHEEMLSEDELIDIVKIAASLGIHKIRITGGEPLVKRNILSIVKRISAIKGIDDIALTTNATKLSDMALDLKNAGIKRLNISLDTFDAEKYAKITRGGNIQDALSGIQTAMSLGFEKIKINTVLIGGFNDDEIEDFAKLTIDSDLDVRFIELMPMFDNELGKDAYLSNDIVKQKLDLMDLGIDGVAHNYQLKGAKGKIGLISPISSSFCSSCNRIRLTADGHLKMCLHSKEEINLKGLSIDEKEKAFQKAILSKPKCHDELSSKKTSNSNISMNQIGG